MKGISPFVFNTVQFEFPRMLQRARLRKQKIGGSGNTALDPRFCPPESPLTAEFDQFRRLYSGWLQILRQEGIRIGQKTEACICGSTG
jgi:hypothetical protein